MGTIGSLVTWITEWAIEINAIVSIFLTGAILWVYLKQRDLMETQTDIQSDNFDLLSKQTSIQSDQTSIQSTQTELMQAQTDLMQSELEARERPLLEIIDMSTHPQNKISFAGSNFGNGVAANLRLQSTLTVANDQIETFPATAPIKYRDSRETYNSSLYPGDRERELVSHVVCGIENVQNHSRSEAAFLPAIMSISQVLDQEEAEIRLQLEVMYDDILGNTFSEEIVDTGRAYVSSGMGIEEVI